MKLADYPDLAEFITSEPAAVVALPIDKQGSIHAAGLRYCHTAEPLAFYFVTNESTEKCRLLVRQKTVQGACVIGSTLGVPFTLQMRGQFSLVDPARHSQTVEAYYQKRGNRHDDIVMPGNVLLQFTPTWARFTDYSKNYQHFALDVGFAS